MSVLSMNIMPGLLLLVNRNCKNLQFAQQWPPAISTFCTGSLVDLLRVRDIIFAKGKRDGSRTLDSVGATIGVSVLLLRTDLVGLLLQW